jgi:predicted small lipoprotein YifL
MEVPAKRPAGPQGIINFMKAKGLWILVGLAGLLSACGQKGPLVLPDAQHAQKKVTLPALPKAPRPPNSAPAAAPSESTAPAGPVSAPPAATEDPSTPGTP